MGRTRISNERGYAGVVIISKIPFEYEERGIGDYELDKEGRLVVVDFGAFHMGVGYFPNSGKRGNLVGIDKRMRFNKGVAKTLKELNKPFVLMGDLNVVSGDDGVEGGLALNHWKNHQDVTHVKCRILQAYKRPMIW